MFQGEPGFEFYSIKKLDLFTRLSGWGFLIFGLLAIACFVSTIFLQDWAAVLIIAGVVSISICSVMSIAWLVLLMVFLYRANCNLRAIGTKDLRYSPGWAVGSWFIPFLSLVWPWLAMGEIYKASHSPFGTKWKKDSFPGVVTACWVSSILGLFFIALPLFAKITKTIAAKQERYAG
jgi:hypothetical protein